MSNRDNDDIRGNDSWLDTTIHQWADKPVGKLPSDLHSQVVRRMSEPIEKVNYQRVTLALGALLLCCFAGWWLILSDGNREDIAEGKVAGAGHTDGSVVAITTDQTFSPEQYSVTLQEVQAQVESLEVQLLIGRMDASISEMEVRCQRLKDQIAQREQNCAHAAIKHGVITDWLANQ